MKDSALIIFGLQNDFLSVGNATFDGLDEISNNLKAISGFWKHIILINQNHPANHISFAACHPWRKPQQMIIIDGKNQYLWPIHCVSNTLGALNPRWITELQPLIIQHESQKGMDNFSVFENESFKAYLSNNKINHLYFSGFPLEYEIKENAFIALAEGFDITLISDCILSLDIALTKIIYQELRTLGAKNIFQASLTNN
jgi:nicotinamidase/pyrazinamidase